MKIIRKNELKVSGYPDWIVLRTGKINLDSIQKSGHDGYNVTEKLKKIINTHSYEKFEWTAYRARINNSYDISVHRYRQSIKNFGTVQVYKLVERH